MATDKIKINKVEKDKGYAKFEIAPFERGYGNTFATPLRRVLLSSIPGTSITKLRIKGCDHEYSTIKGIKEDVINIVINLQAVVFKLTSSETETVTLSVHGVKDVKASDLKLPGNVEVMNPEAHITSLTDKSSSLEIEITLEAGQGFELADQELRNREPGIIPLNKNFSPVDKVNVEIQSTRVGKRTDYEKIILEVWTNGEYSPEEALQKSADIFMQKYTDLNDVIQNYSESDEEQEVESDDATPAEEEVEEPSDEKKKKTKTKKS